MKPSVLLLLLTLCLNHHAFSQKKSMMLEGTAKIGDSLAMKVTEVDIEEWMIFILNNHYDSTLFPNIAMLSKQAQLLFLDLKKERDFDYLKMEKVRHPDLRVIENVKQTSAFTKLCKEDSIEFSILAAPITGITYSQANRYCTWLEAMVTKYRKIDVTISLPTISVYSSVNPNLDSLTRHGCPLYNFIGCDCVSQTKEDHNQSLGKYLVRVDAYFPTALGIYNLQGNAAEMTTIEGKAMGGSFRHYAKDSFSDKIQHYSGPTEWLGFRYIVHYN